MDKGCKGGSCALNSGICVSLSVEEWGERQEELGGRPEQGRWGASLRGSWKDREGHLRCLLWVRAMLPTVAVPVMHAWKAEVVVQVPQCTSSERASGQMRDWIQPASGAGIHGRRNVGSFPELKSEETQLLGNPSWVPGCIGTGRG